MGDDHKRWTESDTAAKFMTTLKQSHKNKNNQNRRTTGEQDGKREGDVETQGETPKKETKDIPKV